MNLMLAQFCRRRLWAGLLAFALSGVAPVCAEVPGTNAAPQRLTLAEARRLAFERNWDLLAAKANVDLATAQKLVAGELPNPTVSLQVLKINTDAQPAHTLLGNSFFHRNYDSIAAFNQLIEIGGKRSARKASALAGIAGARARFADTRRQLELGVTQGYVAMLLADEQVKVLRDSAASLRKEAGIAEIRLQAGDISRADRNQISIAADRLELDARRAESDAKAARIQLEVLLGLNQAQGDVVPGDSLEQLAASPTPAGWGTPGTFLPEHRPDVLAARADVTKADADLRLQKSQRIPDPTFLVQYEREPPDQPNTVGFGVSFPLPLWSLNRGNIAVAAAAKAQAEVRARQAEAAAFADVSAARFGLSSASERRERYVKEIVPHSAEITATVRFAYQKGGASLLDLLSAERNDNDVRLAAAQATADTAAAAATLVAALGEVQPADLKP
jgi:outer membrane protein, heavy metal efflux system